MTDIDTSTTTAKSHAEEVVRDMCVAYASAVNASDSLAYSKLFTEEAVRMPPGAEPEHGRHEIRRGEQDGYDAFRLSIRSTPTDAVHTGDRWIYAIADVEGTATSHVDAETSSFRATKTWLLQRQDSGEWLIARQMWNLKPASCPTATSVRFLPAVKEGSQAAGTLAPVAFEFPDDPCLQPRKNRSGTIPRKSGW